MPNHVKNILTITGKKKELNSLKNFVHDKENKNLFSLNNILPMPPEDELDNVHLNVMPKWYNWRVENWGTKWDAYEVEMTRVDDKTLNYIFLTAWASPIYALVALSEKYPNLEFKLMFADEDIGNNCGYLQIVGGDIVQEDYPDDADGDELALDVWDLHDQYEFVDGEYRYKENLRNLLN